MPAQDAGVTAVLPALIVYPHIVYLLSIVRPRNPYRLAVPLRLMRWSLAARPPFRYAAALGLLSILC